MEICVNWDSVVDAPYFSFDGQVKEAKVVEVYDGDTIKVIFSHNGKLWKWRVRLMRINAPEIRGEYKDGGIKVRDFLRELILDKIVIIECKKFDSFGRILAEVIYNSDNISDKLLELESVVVYR